VIVPIVLHRVVESACDEFEDVTIASLDRVLGKKTGQYIVTDDIDDLKIKSKEKYYLISFDDGCLSDYEIVFPRLKKLNIKATFFVNIENVGKSGFTNWDMLKEMKGSKMSIGSHGYSHTNMTMSDKTKAKFNLLESKKCLENILFDDVYGFSFPYGKYNTNLIGLAKSVGYKYCFSSRHGVIVEDSDIYPRNSINGSMTFEDIDRILNLKLYTRFIWTLEDVSKILIKFLFGDRMYVTVRKFIVSGRKNA